MPPESRRLTALEQAFLGAAAIAFLLLATYRLESPGLYADELIFGPAALHALGQCDVQASVSHVAGKCAPLYLHPPYLGAAKAWLYAPIFAFVDPSPGNIRVPAILASLLGLALALRWLRYEIGGVFAIAVVIVLALDPVVIVHSRFDWGPFVLSNLCKLGLLLAMTRWRDSGKPFLLAISLALALVGFYDKLTFLWIIIAFGGALLLCWPRTVLAHLRRRPGANALLIGGFVVLMAAACWVLVLPAMQFDLRAMPTRLNFASQAHNLVQLYNDTFSSNFVRTWMTSAPPEVPSWPFRVLVGQFVFMAVLAVRRPWSDPGLARAWNLLAFASLAILLLLLQMLGTRQLGGAHHLVALWPLPTLQLALLAWIGAQLFADPARRDRAGLASMLLFAGIAVAATVPRHVDLLATWRGQYAFHAAFDPGITRLAQRLRGSDARMIVSADWGLHQPLVMLADSAERPKYVEWWPIFAEPYAIDPRRNQWLRETFLDLGDSVWIMYAPAHGVIPGVRAQMIEHLREWGGCLRADGAVARDDGSPLYEIWRYRPGAACQPPDLDANDSASD